jgi:hypothetical protein
MGKIQKLWFIFMIYLVNKIRTRSAQYYREDKQDVASLKFPNQLCLLLQYIVSLQYICYLFLMLA